MPSVVNDHILQEMKGEVETNPYAFISSFEGVTVEQISALRRDLEKSANRSVVVKHSLVRRAFDTINVTFAEDFLKGNVLVTLGEKDPQDVSKALIDFSKENENFKTAGVVFEKELHGDNYVKSLASLPSRQELLTQMVVRMKSPISGFVLTLNQMIKGLVVALNEVKKQKEQSA